MLVLIYHATLQPNVDLKESWKIWRSSFIFILWFFGVECISRQDRVKQTLSMMLSPPSLMTGRALGLKVSSRLQQTFLSVFLSCFILALPNCEAFLKKEFGLSIWAMENFSQLWCKIFFLSCHPLSPCQCKNRFSGNIIVGLCLYLILHV